MFIHPATDRRTRSESAVIAAEEWEAAAAPAAPLRIGAGVALATLDMHPLDTLDRRDLVKNEFHVGYCNITKCCTEVCPEHIHITDNGIIPLKERVADSYFDPIRWAIRKASGAPARKRVALPLATDRAGLASPGSGDRGDGR